MDDTWWHKKQHPWLKQPLSMHLECLTTMFPETKGIQTLLQKRMMLALEPACSGLIATHDSAHSVADKLIFVLAQNRFRWKHWDWHPMKSNMHLSQITRYDITKRWENIQRSCFWVSPPGRPRVENQTLGTEVLHARDQLRQKAFLTAISLDRGCGLFQFGEFWKSWDVFYANIWMKYIEIWWNGNMNYYMGEFLILK